MFSNEVIIGIIVLAVLIVILMITKNNRAQQQQEHNQPLEATSFNSLFESELSKGTDGESLIEILGLENLPREGQEEVIKKAGKVIEIRCLNRVLESLSKHEKQNFSNALEEGDFAVVQNFLKSRHIDLSAILREEGRRFKREMADKLS